MRIKSQKDIVLPQNKYTNVVVGSLREGLLGKSAHTKNSSLLIWAAIRQKQVVCLNVAIGCQNECVRDLQKMLLKMHNIL
jgi:hypothetical protein